MRNFFYNNSHEKDNIITLFDFIMCGYAGRLRCKITIGAWRRLPTQLSGILIFWGCGDYEVPPSSYKYELLILVINAYIIVNIILAGMAKLVDALDLGSSGATHKSSSLFTRTKSEQSLCESRILAFSSMTCC